MSLDANVSDTMMDEIARQLGVDAADLKKTGFLFFPLVMPVHITNLQRNLAPYGGEVVHNYNEVTLVNNVTKNEALTVPATKRWYLMGGFILNGDDVARVCVITVRIPAGNTIMRLIKSQSIAAATDVYYPNTEASVDQIGHGAYPIPLEAGTVINFQWTQGGASAGGTGKFAALVVEVDE